MDARRDERALRRKDFRFRDGRGPTVRKNAWERKPNSASISSTDDPAAPDRSHTPQAAVDGTSELPECAFHAYRRTMPKNAERHSRTGIGQAVAGPYRTAAATLSASPALRTFALLTAVNALGNGLFAALSVLYYTRHLGVPVGVVSAVLVAATVLAIGGDLLSGRYSDRASPKPVLLAGLVLSAAATALLLVVDGLTSFVLVLCLISLGQGLCMSSNTTLIRRIARE